MPRLAAGEGEQVEVGGAYRKAPVGMPECRRALPVSWRSERSRVWRHLDSCEFQTYPRGAAAASPMSHPVASGQCALHEPARAQL